VAFKCANFVMAIIFKFLCGGKKLKHVGLSCREKVCVMVDVYSGIGDLSDAVEEVKLAKQGKIKLKSAEALLDEL